MRNKYVKPATCGASDLYIPKSFLVPLYTAKNKPVGNSTNSSYTVDHNTRIKEYPRLKVLLSAAHT
jgi:hypothetical protein